MQIENIRTRLTDKTNILSYAGGFIFVLIFIWGYSNINNNWYEYRDDGVITMSSAKNLADMGFIGVSVSGPKVEASSSPMQFFVYAFIYKITGANYAEFSYWQTILATFILGFLFIRFFSDKPFIALFVTTLSAIILTKFYPFFEWHASGMENPITHVLFLSTIFILYQSIKKNIINNWLAIIVFMATIARLDSVYHIATLLIIYSLYWKFLYKNLKAFYFSIIVFFLWLLFQCLRYYYFGDFLPNTAYAQGISLSDRFYLLVNMNKFYLDQSFNLAKEIFIKQAGWLLFAILPLQYFFKPNRNNSFLIIALLSIVLTSTLNPFLFGATRIDHVRTTTQMTIAVLLVVSILIYNSKSKQAALSILLLSLPFVITFYNQQNMKPYYLGWSTKGFNSVRTKFTQIAKENNIERPTISNPDLGVMTWYKQFNDIDLGMLGSPIMAKLRNGPLMSEYYLNYGLPDLIEAHGGWIKRYCNSIFTQNKFTQLYSQIGTNYDMTDVCSAKENPPMIYWIRNDIMKKSNSNERKFLNSLQAGLSINKIKQEIDQCKSAKGSCGYISRTVFKFIPELRKTKQFDAVYDLFISEKDKALLRGWKDCQAYNSILNSVVDSIFHVPQREPDIKAKYNIYIDGNNIIYVKDSCRKDDIKHTFYLHVFPKDKHLKLNGGGDSFQNMDFNFDGVIKNDTCIIVKKLPNFAIKSIDTGQYDTIYDKNKKRTFLNFWKAHIDCK